MGTIEKFVINPAKDLLSKLPFDVELSLAICGMALVLVFFLISLIFCACSRTKKLKKNLLKATDYLRAGDGVTEENVSGLNSKIKTLSDPIQRGWSYFLEQKDGYPSDYITERDVFAQTKPAKGCKVFFGIFSALIIVFTILLSYVICKDASWTTVGLADFTKDFKLVGSIIADFCAPLFVFVICRIILGGICRGQLKKTKRQFVRFQNQLDEKVLICNEDEEEFVSENIGAINAQIEEILANKLDKKQTIEIISVPKIEEVEEIEEPVEIPAEPEIPEVEEPAVEELPAEPIEEPVVEETPEEEVVAAVPETEEEKEARLIALVYLCQDMLNDEEVTKDDIEEFTFVLYEQLQKRLDIPEDKEIIETCLEFLAAFYFEKFGE